MLRRFVILFVINGALATPGWKGSERKLERGEDYYPPADAPYDPTPVAKTAPAYAPIYEKPAYEQPFYSPTYSSEKPTKAPKTYAPFVAPVYTESPTKTPKTHAPYVSPVYTESPTKTPKTKAPYVSPVYTESPTKTPKTKAPYASPVYTEKPTKAPKTNAPYVSPVHTESPVTAPNDDPTLPATNVPTLKPVEPLSPVEEPTSPVSLITPSPTKSSPVTAAPVTSSPTSLPSAMPSITPASVFINEMGSFEGADFIEVVYSSFLGSGINNYTFHLYSGEGLLLASESLTEGDNSLNGLTFTFAVYPNTTADVEAVALVDDKEEVLNFLSLGEVVTAIDGPAEGMDSKDIMPIMGNAMASNEDAVNETETRRRLEDSGNETEVDSSFGLVGTGCEFDEFTFAMNFATPGYVNVGQDILDCHGTDAPSASPSIDFGGEDGISTGAIVAISISGGLLLLVLVYLYSNIGGPRDVKPTQANRELNAEPQMIIELDKELMAREEQAQKNFSLGTGEVTMVDTGAKVDGAMVSVTPSAHSGTPSVTPSVAFSVGTGDMPDDVEDSKEEEK